MSFSDGNSLKHMPAIQDHKRALEGDVGPNTGGMGTYSDADHSLPFLTKKEIKEAQKINNLTAAALKDKYGYGYKGVLYGGFIATSHGIKLIEYNARFGDPEAMNVAILSLTHGQPATPTTFGKEMAVFYNRLNKHYKKLKELELLGIGNFSKPEMIQIMNGAAFLCGDLLRSLIQALKI